MGISGNEMADTLAKQALEKPPVHTHAGVSLGHLKRLAKREILSSWRRSWFTREENEGEKRQAPGMGRQYRLIIRDSLVFSLRPNPFINSLPKKILSAYIQLKTRKGLLKSFQYTIDKASNNKCFCSAARWQDTKHLLLECEKCKKERADMKK